MRYVILPTLPPSSNKFTYIVTMSDFTNVTGMQEVTRPDDELVVIGNLHGSGFGILLSFSDYQSGRSVAYERITAGDQTLSHHAHENHN